MTDVFYDLESRELIDKNAADQEIAIRAQNFSIGASWCECHGESIFHRPAALAKHLLSHSRIIGYNIIRFDNTVLAWSLDRAVRENVDSTNGKSPRENQFETSDRKSFHSEMHLHRNSNGEMLLPEDPYALKEFLDAKSFDLVKEIEARLGYRLSLAAVAEGTLGREKSGTGPRAVVWNRLARTLRDQWPYALTDVGDAEGAQRVAELGEWFQERLEQYCLADVMLVKRIFEYGLENKRIAYVDFEGERRQIKVRWR